MKAAGKSDVSRAAAEIVCTQAAAEDSFAAAVKVRIGGAAKKRARESSAVDAESMGAPGRSTNNAQSDPLAVLGDAGMVLRDPATMRLIIHHVSSSCSLDRCLSIAYDHVCGKVM